MAHINKRLLAPLMLALLLRQRLTAIVRGCAVLPKYFLLSQ